MQLRNAKENRKLIDDWIDGLSISETDCALTACVIRLIETEEVRIRVDEESGKTIVYWDGCGDSIIGD